MPKKLKRLVIDRVDLVDKGANPGAHICLFKRDDSEETVGKGRKLSRRLRELMGHKVQEGRARSEVINEMASAARVDAGTINQILRGEITRPPNNRLAGLARVLRVSARELQNLADEDNEAVSQRESDMDGKTDKTDKTEIPEETLSAMEKRIQDLTDQLEKALKPEKPDEDDIWKGVSPDLKKRFETIEARAQAAEEAAAFEKSEREKAHYIAKARQFTHLPLNAEQDWRLLHALGNLAPDLAARAETLLDAAEALGKKARLTERFGSSAQTTATSATGQLMELAKGRLAKAAELGGGPIDLATAMGIIARENPALYDQYVQECQVRVGGNNGGGE